MNCMVVYIVLSVRWNVPQSKLFTFVRSHKFYKLIHTDVEEFKASRSTKTLFMFPK